MRAELKSSTVDWRSVGDSANITMNDLKPRTSEPSTAWAYRMLLAEHSPIRKLTFDIIMHDLKSWISVHFVTHKIGIEHFVQSQRTDRTGVDRDSLPQNTLVNHEIVLNAQALITISRKRLCNCASPETRAAWKEVLRAVCMESPLIYAACVPDCVYRGWCYEMKSCGFHLTKEYLQALDDYRTVNGRVINGGTV